MISNDQKLEVVEMYTAGLDVYSIREELNISVPSIYRILKENDVQIRGRSKREVPDIVKEAALNLLNTTEMTATQICEQLDISYIYLCALGVDVPKRRRGIRERKMEQAIKMYEYSVKVSDIIAATKITQSEFYKELAKRGLKRR